MISIVAGKWRGRTLDQPDTRDVRPTANRVRESIFNIVHSYYLKQHEEDEFAGAAVLDLFAGAGGLGFEALSRGADRVVFVEQNKTAQACIKRNQKTLQCQSDSMVLHQPAERGGWVKTGPYKFIFVDPPYKYRFFEDILTQIVEGDALLPDGLLVVEHDPKLTVNPVDGLEQHLQRTIGPAGVSIFMLSE